MPTVAGSTQSKAAIEKTVRDYIAQVIEGEIPTGKLHKLAALRHERDMETGADRGLYFDSDAAADAVDFFPHLCHSKGEWAGQPFHLEPWQQFLVWSLFGWHKEETRTRRYRTAYLEIARKCGKSTLGAGVGNYLFRYDNEPGAEVYTAASVRDQARIVHSEAIRMVKSSPILFESGIQVFRDNLCVPALASKFQPLGADADNVHGLNVHGAIVDELHAHKNRAMWDALDTATGSRRQAMILAITTAGYDRETICYKIHEYVQQILEGIIEDDSFFGLICTIEEEDDWQDESIWVKANPNLGVCVKWDDMRRLARQAKEMPGALNTFLRLRLNRWTQQHERWITMELWDSQPCAQAEKDLEKRLCFGGLDLSTTSDIAALVLAFPGPTGIELVCRFWCPEAQLKKQSNRYRDRYREWAAAGHITLTPGNAIDYQLIRRDVNQLAQRFNIKSINIDRLYQGYQLSVELADDLSPTIINPMGQGFMSMAIPTAEFERYLLLRQIRHDRNPVMRWMIDNVSVQQNAAGSLKPDKTASKAKIDGVVAGIMAVDLVLREGKPRRSVYETRGMISVGGEKEEPKEEKENKP